MNTTARIFAEMGIHFEKPDLGGAIALARTLGLDLSDEEAATYSIEIRHMNDTLQACKACSGLEACGSDPVGFEYVFSRTAIGTPSFAVRKCPKRVQYEELRANEELLASSRIPESLRQKSFKTFDNSQNQEASRVAAEIIRDRKRKGAIFYGGTGAGKTHLAAAILNNRIIAGYTGIYATMPELMDDLRSAMRNNRVEDARQALIDTDLLFLDDIGAENPSEFVVEEFFKIVNGRLLRQKQIVGTTNLTPQSFMERYAGLGGARIVSRLHEVCEWVEVFGRDRRM